MGTLLTLRDTESALQLGQELEMSRQAGRDRKADRREWATK